MAKPMRSLTSIKRDFAGAARDGLQGANGSDKNGCMGDAEAIVLSQWLLEDTRSSSCTERSRGRCVGFRIPTGRDRCTWQHTY